jgi:hypothetical protein
MKLSPAAVRIRLYVMRGLRPIAALNAIDSLASAICTAQKTWLMSLKSLAAPTTLPTTLSLPSGWRVRASGGLDGFSGAGSHDGELALSSAGGTTRHGRVADPDALAQGVKTLLNGDEEAWWDCGEANDRSTGFED